MAEDATSSHPSRYVKLTKDQDAPTEDIRPAPGELNQAVHVPQLVGRRCSECAQVLPESYDPARRRALDYRNLRISSPSNQNLIPSPSTSS
ncbi:cell number regulator 6-like [Setaria italica]|uniref:cell number regulator 6-like n=1 Tax=Setaria italica TaxID=4555 RepID=UPI0006480C8A|nr:cell number regulator 6-like [Setaria italica]